MLTQGRKVKGHVELSEKRNYISTEANFNIYSSLQHPFVGLTPI